MGSDDSGDVAAIKAIIARQFASLNWAPGASADWGMFAADFHATASLYPAARPAARQTVEGFVERMQGLAQTPLRTFDEKVLGSDIHIFGNVAVAVAACEMVENGAETSRSVEMLLLVKCDGAWKIVAQAWDKASEANPVPSNLLRG